jgi:hypothetical protein
VNWQRLPTRGPARTCLVYVPHIDPSNTAHVSLTTCFICVLMIATQDSRSWAVLITLHTATQASGGQSDSSQVPCSLPRILFIRDVTQQTPAARRCCRHGMRQLNLAQAWEASLAASRHARHGPKQYPDPPDVTSDIQQLLLGPATQQKSVSFPQCLAIFRTSRMDSYRF